MAYGRRPGERGGDRAPRKGSPLAAAAESAPVEKSSKWLAGRRGFAVHELAAGRSVREVADRLKVSESAVYKWLDHPDAQRELQHLLSKGRDAARSALEGQAQDAAAYVGDVIRGTAGVRPDPVRLKACEMVFDRVGLPKTTKVEAAVKQSPWESLSDEELERIASGELPMPTETAGR